MLGSSSKFIAAALAVGAISLVPTVSAANWTRTSSIRGNDFFSNFEWFTDKDPTNSLVNYQSQSNAQSQNLSFVDGDGHFVMAVSTTPVALEGRNSVRITSKQSYSDGVYILNVTHVPIGCATWPAFWTATENLDSWPIGGEIDIMENANNEYKANLVSAHTSSSCTTPTSISDATGTVAYTNCSAYAPSNPGCRVEMNGTSTPTWGTSLNRAGGGIIAMERSFGTTGKGVRVWYFPNNSPLHSPLRSQTKQFKPHKIIFDITLCGDWAGNTYNQSGCNAQYPACSYQVGYNGSSFNQSYWEVESLRLFTEGGSTANAKNSPQTASSQKSTQSGAMSLVTSGSSKVLALVLAVVASVAFVAAL
ncbi:hypothetical protein NDA14_005963 [Ustilago hordei]|nr:hypothetical protein NDA14_005963 [Ustilago hordei]